MTLLQTKDLSAFYGDFQALFGINVTVDQGEQAHAWQNAWKSITHQNAAVGSIWRR